MILSRCPYAVGTVLFTNMLLVGCGSNRSEPSPLAEAEPVPAAKAAPAPDSPVVKGTVEVRGSPQNLRYDVTFDAKSDSYLFCGNARVERQEEIWPTSFEVQFRGRRQPHILVTLKLDGFGPILLSNYPKKSVNFYDESGKHLDQPIENAFLIQTEDTGECLIAKVKLPEQARSMRGMTIEYETFAW
jgi:hypothetical protein